MDREKKKQIPNAPAKNPLNYSTLSLKSRRKKIKVRILFCMGQSEMQVNFCLKNNFKNLQKILIEHFEIYSLYRYIIG